MKKTLLFRLQSGVYYLIIWGIWGLQQGIVRIPIKQPVFQERSQRFLITAQMAASFRKTNRTATLDLFVYSWGDFILVD